MSWKAIDLGEIEARQKAMDLDVVYNQYGQRTTGERRQVTPPAPVESAAWQPAGELTTGCSNGAVGGVGSAARRAH